MRVLVISEQQSSPPRVWIGWLLAQSGLQMHFVLQNGSPMAKFLRERNLSVEELPLRGRLDFRSLCRLRALLQRVKPDVIHAYTAKTCWLAIWAQWPARRAKIVFYRGATRAPSRWSPSDWLLYFSRSVDVYDCLSTAVATSLIEAGVPADKTLTNYYGHRLEWYAPAEVPRNLPAKSGRFRIGCVANYRKVKGLETLVDAADVLSERRKDFELLIVGSDPEGALANYVARAASRDRIRLTGPIQRPWDVVRTFDCAVVPSNREGLGKAALEALACGVPLVASDVGGLKEIVDSGLNGLLVPPQNPVSLADAIELVLGDPALRERLRENGRRSIQEKFNIERTRDRLVALYARLADSGVGIRAIGERPAG